MTQTSSTVACGVCGAPAPSDPPPVSWSPGMERGRRVWTCDRCARDHIRSIEGHLDQQYW